MWRRLVKAKLTVLQVDRLRFWVYLIKSLRYIGLRFTCPICGGKFRTLLPVGGSGRCNSRCPRCGSAERHRLIWIYLMHHTHILKKRMSFLHVAPEFSLRRLLGVHRNLDYISIDLLKDSAMVRMDVTRLEFPDNSFDAILCSHVLEHIPDDRCALHELHRVLKPGGWAILNVPIQGDTTLEDAVTRTAEERKRWYGDEDHVRGYGRDYAERLSQAGFQVTVVDFQDQLSADEIERCRLAADSRPLEVLHIGVKPEAAV